MNDLKLGLYLNQFPLLIRISHSCQVQMLFQIQFVFLAFFRCHTAFHNLPEVSFGISFILVQKYSNQQFPLRFCRFALIRNSLEIDLTQVN